MHPNLAFAIDELRLIGSRFQALSDDFQQSGPVAENTLQFFRTLPTAASAGDYMSQLQERFAGAAEHIARTVAAWEAAHSDAPQSMRPFFGEQGRMLHQLRNLRIGMREVLDEFVQSGGASLAVVRALRDAEQEMQAPPVHLREYASYLGRYDVRDRWDETAYWLECHREPAPAGLRQLQAGQTQAEALLGIATGEAATSEAIFTAVENGLGSDAVNALINSLETVHDDLALIRQHLERSYFLLQREEYEFFPQQVEEWPALKEKLQDIDHGLSLMLVRLEAVQAKYSAPSDDYQALEQLMLPMRHVANHVAAALSPQGRLSELELAMRERTPQALQQVAPKEERRAAAERLVS